MRRGAPLSTLALALLWAAVATSSPAGAAPPPEPAATVTPTSSGRSPLSGDVSALRRVSADLIALLPEAEITPPLTGHPRVECVRAQPHAPFPSRYSTLPKPLRAHHLRVTVAGGGPGRVELRDSLFFSAPRRFVFEIVPDASPRLEFSYHLFPCAGITPEVRLRVTVEDAEGRASFTALLSGESPKDLPRFGDVSLDLPLAAGRPARLTLEFEAPSARSAIAWSQPVITGRPAPDAPDVGGALNVLLIVIDAVRADVVGPARRPELVSVTPNMDALFAAGTSFRRAYSVANQTRPSTFGFLASLVPSLGGFHSRSWTLTEVRKRALYASRPPLLPRLLSAAGWRVAHIGHNHFLWDSEPIGMDHGFDQAIDFRAIPEDTPETTAAALRFFDRHAADRWFMMLNYTAPHTPYNPPEGEYRRVLERVGPRPLDGLSRKYLGEVAYVDAHLAKVFAELERLGIAERTLIILTADHGEVMHGAHSCNSQRLQMSCHFNHGLTLYDEEIHIPLVFTLPGRIVAGRVVEAQTSQLDLAPTVLAELDLSPAVGQMGRSLAGALAGAPAPASVVYAEARYSAAVRVGDLKLIVHSRDDDIRTLARMGSAKRKEGSARAPKYELFDTASDPFEAKNLVLRGDPRRDLMLVELANARAALAARARERVSVERGPQPESLEPPQGAAPASYGERAANVLRLEPDGTRRHLVAHLSAPEGSRLVCGAVHGQASCEASSERAILLTLAAEDEPSSVAFGSEPWAAPLELSLTMDNKTIPVDALRLGPYGLRLLRQGEALDDIERLRLAAGLYPPHTVPGRLGVYLWRDPPHISRILAALPEEAAAQGEDPDAHMDEQVRAVLRSLGYTH